MVMGAGGWPLMTTAGRRPFSMRAIRAARAGSRGDCCALAVTIALSERVRQEMAARVAKAAKTTRSFFEFELMGENRITFCGGESAID
jgi:hypothetical protein